MNFSVSVYMMSFVMATFFGVCAIALIIDTITRVLKERVKKKDMSYDDYING
jgi:hypothetical protein